MKIKYFFISMVACLAFMVCLAEDITTADGKIYSGVTDIKAKPDGLIFNLNPTNGIGIVKVPFSNLSDEMKRKYNYDPFEEGLAIARNNKVVNLKKNLAFNLADLDIAKMRAQTEHKPIGFVMVWDEFFQPAVPMGNGSVGGLAHFYTVFRNGVVLVFVRHEDELDKVPEAVKKAFSGPDKGGLAPNMAVVSADCSEFICEIPLGGQESNGQTREEIFREKIAQIKKFAAASTK